MPDVVPERAELPHTKEDDELWQESVAVVGHHGTGGMGGYPRIGHEPNCDGGVAALGFGIVTREGARYRRNATSALTEADRLDDGFGAREGRYRAQYDGGMTIRVDETAAASSS